MGKEGVEPTISERPVNYDAQALPQLTLVSQRESWKLTILILLNMELSKGRAWRSHEPCALYSIAYKNLKFYPTIKMKVSLQLWFPLLKVLTAVFHVQNYYLFCNLQNLKVCYKTYFARFTRIFGSVRYGGALCAPYKSTSKKLSKSSFMLSQILFSCTAQASIYALSSFFICSFRRALSVFICAS